MIFNLFCEHPLLRRVQRDVGFTYVKFNGILSDEMHLYSEDTAGKVLLSFAYVDKALDFLLSVGLKALYSAGLHAGGVVQGKCPSIPVLHKCPCQL